MDRLLIAAALLLLAPSCGKTITDQNAHYQTIVGEWTYDHTEVIEATTSHENNYPALDTKLYDILLNWDHTESFTFKEDRTMVTDGSADRKYYFQNGLLWLSNPSLSDRFNSYNYILSSRRFEYRIDLTETLNLSPHIDQFPDNTVISSAIVGFVYTR